MAITSASAAIAFHPVNWKETSPTLLRSAQIRSDLSISFISLFSRILGALGAGKINGNSISQQHGLGDSGTLDHMNHKGRARLVIGQKRLDTIQKATYTFFRWTRGDLGQLAPRKKLLKSRTSTD